MANVFIYCILDNRVASYSNKMKKILSKLHKPSSRTAFIKNSLYKNVTPTFAKIKGQFLNGNAKLNAEKDLMKSHLNKHFNDIRDLRLEFNAVKDKWEGEIDPIFTDIKLKSISKSLQRERLESFRTKNKTLFNLAKRKTKQKFNSKVPVINLSNYQLNEKEYDQLKM